MLFRSDGLDAAKKMWNSPAVDSEVTPSYMMGCGLVDGYNIITTLFAQNQGITRYNMNMVDVANIYASELKAEKVGDNYLFSFKLNENAVEVDLEFIYNNKVVDVIQAGAMEKGLRTIEVPISSLPQIESEDDVDLYWQIRAEALSAMRIYKISDNAERFQYYAPYGVAVNNSMESDYFGRVYLTETRGGTCSGGRTVTKGLFTLNALLEDDMQQGTNGYNGNVTWNATNSPYRLSVAEDGRIFLCDFSDAHSGIWIADPANLNGTFTELLDRKSVV